MKTLGTYNEDVKNYVSNSCEVDKENWDREGKVSAEVDRANDSGSDLVARTRWRIGTVCNNRK